MQIKQMRQIRQIMKTTNIIELIELRQGTGSKKKSYIIQIIEIS